VGIDNKNGGSLTLESIRGYDKTNPHKIGMKTVNALKQHASENGYYVGNLGMSEVSMNTAVRELSSGNMDAILIMPPQSGHAENHAVNLISGYRSISRGYWYRAVDQVAGKIRTFTAKEILDQYSIHLLIKK
jgi:hypothetical protein